MQKLKKNYKALSESKKLFQSAASKVKESVRKRNVIVMPTVKEYLMQATNEMACLKGLLDYAIKIAATWVACKKLHARIARPFTLRIQHRAIFERVSVIGYWIFNSVSVIVFQFVIVCLKSDPVYQLNFMKSIHNLFSFLNKELLNE